MEKNDSPYILHILDAISAIEKYTRGFNREKFIEKENQLVQDAVIRELKIIGEAVRKLSQKIKTDNPHLPWREIEGMRNKLIHEYFGVDLGVVWQTVAHDLTILKEVASSLKESL